MVEGIFDIIELDKSYINFLYILLLSSIFDIIELDKFEFEGVFLCQQLKLKTSLSHIMAM